MAAPAENMIKRHYRSHGITIGIVMRGNNNLFWFGQQRYDLGEIDLIQSKNVLLNKLINPERAQSYIKNVKNSQFLIC